jgi:hypothetical protein
MIYLLGSLVMLNIFDAVITHYLIQLGIATEGNPLLAPLLGEPSFFLVKIIGSLLAAFILWDVTRRYRALGIAATSCCVGAYSIIVLWNTSIFFIS